MSDYYTALVRGVKIIKMNFIKKIFMFSPESYKDEFELKKKEKTAEYDVRDKDIPKSPDYVDLNIKKNIAYIQNRFNVPLNNDVVIREITMRGNREAFLVFYDGMCDTDSINKSIIKTLIEIPYYEDKDIYKYNDEIIKRFVINSQAMSTDEMEKICEEINFGSCALFVDGYDKGFIMDVRKWGTRSIDAPKNEQSIYGPQEAFAEMLRTNTALIRKIIKTEKLIAEGVKIGNISKTRGVLLYINDIANSDLVDEVKRRINGISIDYVIASEEVGMLIEDNGVLMTSQIMYTERPDRAARALIEGKVVLLLNGSPHAIVFPTTAFEMLHAVSDDYMRLPFANVTRAIRVIAFFISVMLPGLYLAVTLFNHEIIPTYLLYSISAARENVPFPSLIELLLMLISFEMIREAGIRMPSPVGSTLGIVGALILGQSAVSAKIVSPLMIIVIAITGIGSFAVPDYSLSWTTRILQGLFIVFGAFFGLYGIAMGIFIYSLLIASQKSFGVPLLSPMIKIKNRSMANSIFENPIWKREYRPSFLKTKKNKNESKISMNWKIKRFGKK